MLDVTPYPPSSVDTIASDFIRDGFACIADALTPEQLSFAQEGARRVVADQTGTIPLEKGNRGFARYSFGSQIEHAEWRQLIDLSTVLPVLEKIWGTDTFQSSGVGGDYSLPGAKIQHLHADIHDPLNDPLGKLHIMDLPAPFIVVNFLVTDFTPENGPTRFIRGTQRSRHPIPGLDEEPDWMKGSILCARAGTAIVRDVRCWHGGTENRSDAQRVMISSGYTASWFRLPRSAGSLDFDIYQTLSSRSKSLCASIVRLPDVKDPHAR
jgi:hypothetical protein